MPRRGSRLIIPTGKLLIPEQGFNVVAHEDDTAPTRHVWTSRRNLGAGTYTPFYPMRTGDMVAIRGSIDTAGTTATTFKVLVNGQSATDSAISVPANTAKSKRWPVTLRPSIYEDSKLEVQIVSVGTNADGPLVVEIEILEAL